MSARIPAKALSSECCVLQSLYSRQFRTSRRSTLMDAEIQNRYRLRLREAVRDPSAPVASLPSVRMTIKATWNRYPLRLREAVRDPSAPRASLASVRMTIKATRNRYRLRLREAVRDPSAPRASLASVRMTSRRLGTGTGFASAKLSEILPLRERRSLRSG